MIIGTNKDRIYITPSTNADAKSASGLLPTIKAAFPRIRVKDSRGTVAWWPLSRHTKSVL